MYLMPVTSFLPKEIPTAAWVVLVVIGLFIFFLNFSLISAFRRKDSNDATVIQRLMNSVRDPNQKDNDNLNELRKRVQHLKDSKDKDQEE